MSSHFDERSRFDLAEWANVEWAEVECDDVKWAFFAWASIVGCFILWALDFESANFVGATFCGLISSGRPPVQTHRSGCAEHAHRATPLESKSTEGSGHFWPF